MYDRILFPTDGSDGTAVVAEHVGELATAMDATVHVLSVVDTRNRFESPASGLASEAWDEAERERAAAAAADAAAALPEDVPVETAVQEGVPDEEIVAYATEHVDAIAMGTRGRTGVDRYLIGSVAERVVRRSPVPVLTVRIED